jgi:DNA replication and repair protein RecF
MSRNRQGTLQLRVNTEEIDSIATLAPLFPVRVIHSQSHHLFELGPHLRRKYLDWGLFYHYPEFISCWRDYERILRQRNQLLRDRKGYSSEMTAWTDALVQQAECLHQLRSQYLHDLLPHLYHCLADLLPQLQLTVDYSSGWVKRSPFAEALKQSLHDECRAGYTLLGPHRADLEMRVQGMSVKQILSRGQQKLLICAMIIAQGHLCFQALGKRVAYLIDDLSSELDQNSIACLLRLLAKQEAQIFVSAITDEGVIDAIRACAMPFRVFHVKHQNIEQKMY